jgi:hypothetical protein
MKERSVASFVLCSQCCWNKHQNFFEYYTKEINFSVSTTFYSKDDLKTQTRQWCVQYENTRHTGIHGRKKQNDLVSTVSRRNMSVHVSAARHHWDRFHLFKGICFFSADVVSVRQCKISAKYGCSVTVALLWQNYQPTGWTLVICNQSNARGQQVYCNLRLPWTSQDVSVQITAYCVFSNAIR